MKYAQTGIRSYVPPGGACIGHRYEDRPDQGDVRMSVDCVRCEPHLAGDPLWASSPSDVPLTDREQKAADEAERKSTQVASMAVANLATLFGAAATNPQALADALQGVATLAPAAAALPTGPAAKGASGRARKSAAAKTSA